MLTFLEEKALEISEGLISSVIERVMPATFSDEEQKKLENRLKTDFAERAIGLARDLLREGGMTAMSILNNDSKDEIAVEAEIEMYSFIFHSLLEREESLTDSAYDYLYEILLEEIAHRFPVNLFPIVDAVSAIIRRERQS